jgi:type VI secretion system secreted protein VgrG
VDRLTLSFASGQALSVRRFSVREALSTPWEVLVVARSPLPDLDLEAFLNRKASLTIRSGVAHVLFGERTWTGLCSHMEQTRVEKPVAGSTPLSTYHLRIVPTLWVLGQRSNNRVFQRMSTPDIVKEVLGEWGISPKLVLAKTYPVHDYIVQYAETDLAFVSRLLERAGITYYFAFAGGQGGALTLDDHPQDLAERPKIPNADSANQSAEKEFVSQVRLAHQVRPGKVTIRDFDFRRKLDYALLGSATPAPSPEDFYERYLYLPGSTLAIDPADADAQTPIADDKGKVRSVDALGTALAERWLASERRDKRSVTFHTNCIDLAPSTTFTIDGHPRADVGKTLLVTRFTVEGSPDGEWAHEGVASFAASPWEPDLRTPRPCIDGVQSAVVVGPSGQEIYTDEIGRVRVQFPWDRKGTNDDKSSCWMRVSQGWAGRGFGTIMIPRIGQEVLVAFFEGDPDLPVVIGRAYNLVEPMPRELTMPDNMTRSTWMSDTSPHRDNSYNEIRYEDLEDKELIYVQAQRDLQKLVKRHETERTGQNRAAVVGRSRAAIVAEVDATLVGVKYSLQMMKPPQPADLKILEMQKPEVTPTPTKVEIVDGKILVTSGKATATFEGADIVFEAKGNITFNAKGDVIVEGGSDIKINC